MKKLVFVLVLLALLMVPSTVGAQEPCKKGNCTTIQSGELLTSDGELITTGYSGWGYNYQAHIFNGDYCDYHPVYRPGGALHEWCIENYGDVDLVMKWSDVWLSNKDCNGDGKLDRGYSCDPENADSSACEGAWTTNHMVGGKGKDHWTYFVKIVAAPEDGYVDEPYDEYGNGTWYTAGGTEIGPQIWGAFAIVQEVESGAGVLYLSPAGPGFGKWK